MQAYHFVSSLVKHRGMGSKKNKAEAIKDAFIRFDICTVNNLPGYGDLSQVFGMVWRFLPLSDPTVDIMVSRDLDSR